MIVRITSRFRELDSVHHTPHTGIDIALQEGSPIRTIQDGIVKKLLHYGNKNVGEGIIVKNQDGTEAIYGHLSKIEVKEGDILHKGQEIALSGNTGHSTGAHLHLGLKDSHGSLIDPSTHVNDVIVNSHIGILDRIVANGKVGDGIGDIPHFSIWEWLGGKVSEITLNNTVDFISDFAFAFPFLAVISFGVYALVNMFSKDAAKWSALGTILYGIVLLRSG